MTMEYNLLKTIESSVGTNFIPTEKYPRLSPYPASDFVNPGLGQICRLHSFYVPLYTNKSLHEKQKTNTLENLEGSGSIEKANESTETPESTETVESKDLTNSANSTSGEIDPNEFNFEKRKRLGPAIQESFLHPKLIKTDKILFKAPLKSERKFKPKATNQNTTVKHKFKLLD